MELRLADAVRTLREELDQAAAQAEGQGLTFTVGPIQMEFEVQFQVDARAKGGFAAWIVTGEAEAGAGRTSTHKVSFTLTPREASRPNGDVSIGSTHHGAERDTPPPAFTR